MKAIELTNGGHALVDDADFDRLSQVNWRLLKSKKILYAMGWKGDTHLLMHRVVLGLADGVHCDHIDGNGLNNQRQNLRPATQQQNCRNRRKAKTCARGTKATSVFKGVRLQQSTGLKPKWRASICVSRKSVHLGLFKTEVEAALAYDRKARELFGEFAKCNFSPAPAVATKA